VLSRRLIDARLVDEGEQGVLIDLNARLMGMITAINLGEQERAGELFADVAWSDAIKCSPPSTRSILMRRAVTPKLPDSARSERSGAVGRTIGGQRPSRRSSWLAPHFRSV
jgi:hypothetical protein